MSERPLQDRSSLGASVMRLTVVGAAILIATAAILIVVIRKLANDTGGSPQPEPQR